MKVTAFDMSWVEMLTRAMDGNLYGPTIVFPSVLDVFPTLKECKPVVQRVFHSPSWADSVGVIRSTPTDSSVRVVIGNIEVYIYPPTPAGLTCVDVYVPGVSCADLPGIAAMCSQVALLRMAYTKSRPGAMRFISPVVFLPENEVLRKMLMSIVIDNPPSKMEIGLRRRRNTRNSWNTPKDTDRDLLDEARLFGSVMVVRESGLQVSRPHEPEWQHSLVASMALIATGEQQPTVDDKAVLALASR